MSEQPRDIMAERRQKMARFGNNDYAMLPNGQIIRRQPKPWRNKAERKVLKRLKVQRLQAEELAVM